VTWLVRFGDPTWQQQLQRWAQDLKFHATLKPKLDAEIEDWHKTQPPTTPPPIVEPDELRIRAPWTEP